MIAEDRDDFAPSRRGLALELLEVADDAKGLGAAVGNVAELDQGRLAPRPAVGGVDQAGIAGDCEPGRIVAVKVADRDDALLCGLAVKVRRERQRKQERGQADDPTKQGKAPTKAPANVSLRVRAGKDGRLWSHIVRFCLKPPSR